MTPLCPGGRHYDTRDDAEQAARELVQRCACDGGYVIGDPDRLARRDAIVAARASRFRRPLWTRRQP